MSPIHSTGEAVGDRSAVSDGTARYSTVASMASSSTAVSTQGQAERQFPQEMPTSRSGFPRTRLQSSAGTVSYTHLRAHETVLDLVCRLLLEKKNKTLPNSNHTSTSG